MIYIDSVILNLSFSLIVLTLAASLVLVYSTYAIRAGRTINERVLKEGSSELMPQSTMDIAYWGIEKLGNLFVALKITPNQISICSLVLGFVAGASLARGDFGLAGFFTTFSSLMDAVDGYVARQTHVASDSGEVLDAAVDRYVEFFFLGGLCIYYRESPVMLIIALTALLGSYMVSYSSAKAEALKVEVPRGNMRRTERAFYLAAGAVFSPITIWYFERQSERPWGYPMVFALVMIAVLANYSAYIRLRAISDSLKK